MFTFSCSGCGKCCHGWLPLTIAETLAFAPVAPVALIWHIHRRGSPLTPHYRAARKLFPTVALPGGEAVPWIRPAVLVPPDIPCVHLTGGLCGIHDAKPLRCRTMPFHANLPADAQEAWLKPGPDWPCYNPADGGTPLYDRGRFLDHSYRAAFRAETDALAADARLLRDHVTETVAAGGDGFTRLLARLAATPGGHLVTPWSRLAAGLAAAGADREVMIGALRGQAGVLAARLTVEALPQAYAAHYRTLAEDVAATLAALTSANVAA